MRTLILALALALALVCRPGVGQDPLGAITFNPSWDDVVIVARNETYDPGTDATYAAYVLDAAAALDGVWLLDDEFGAYYRFPTERKRDDFLDLVESPERAATGAPVRFRDIVDYAEIVGTGAELLAPPNDPYYQSGQQCNIDSVRVQQSWDLLPAGIQSVLVAILDTGCNPSHADLAGRVDPNGKNFTSYPGNAPTDNVGHGTFVSGIVAAITGNGYGIAGCAPTPASGPPLLTVLPVKVFKASSDPDVTGTMVAKAIGYAVDQGAKVVNMSFQLAPNTNKTAVSNAIDDAHDNGVVVVAAAGNDDDNDAAWFTGDSDFAQFPASDPDVISVGAVTCANNKTLFSNWGTQVDVGAPGLGIRSTTAGGGFGTDSGTSFSAPHVASLAGLMKGILPLGSSSKIGSLIFGSSVATNNGPSGKVPFKHGTVDFVNAVNASLNAGPDAPPCVGLPTDGAWKVKAKGAFKSSVAYWQAPLPPEGVELDLKDEDDQCTALLATAAVDQAYSLVKSTFANKKEQVVWQYRFVADQWPTQHLRLKLWGEMASLDDANREIQVQFWNYAQKKWGKPITKVVDDNVPFIEAFEIDTNLADHVKSPSGYVRCKIKMRHKQASSKQVPFGLYLDRVRLVVN